MRRSALLATLAIIAALAPGAGRADDEPEFPRPGPPVLYQPLATAPQLQNVDGWRARPLMVSGADAYDDGEYLYQDYVYDSYGANTSNVPADQPDTTPSAANTLFGAATGDVVYPTDAKTYAYDAADLLEFRARPVTGGIDYRITLNTMITPDAAGVAIGIDSDRNAATGKDDWGYGIGSLGHLGIDHELVTWGTGATFDGAPVPVTVDTDSNQIDVVVPLDAHGATVRHYVAVGLFDATAKAFKQIQDQPTDTLPGGAHMSSPPPIFNIGFRFAEPMGSQQLSDPTSATTLLNLGTRASGYGHWREDGQAHALAARDISAYHADVDFSKLAAGVDESHVPTHGFIDRLYVSHLDLGEGAQPTRPMLLGKIQPYAVYVPSSYIGRPSPLHLLMHSLSCSYNQYGVFTPNQLRQLGDQRNSFLLTPEGRGPDGWYHDAAEVDVFEAWADLMHHYDIDMRHVTVGGYSMGGYGTFKLASQYPDLFARGFAVVGPADESITGAPTGGMVAGAEDNQNTIHIADNLRNVPLLMWEGTNDELVPLAGTLQYEKRLADLGYRHTQWIIAGYDHFLASIDDQWAEGRDFLDESSVNRAPEEVVYRAMPEMDNVAYGLVHDHAYWVTDVVPVTGARSGLIDARAESTFVGKPEPYDTASVHAQPAPLRGAWIEKGVDWRSTTQDARNQLTLNLTDLASATLWIQIPRIDTHQPIAIVSDANVPSTITLAGSFGRVTVAIPAGHNEQTVTV